ncbi:Cdc6/Cdc18 family protein [Halopiger aswanensis]|uniref:Cdc6-like AAA superfamily ATPase n=1 Tax=Halopiger aswanensis TaxID=148449 RepID=A0A3R7DAJ9_9EURY|nr:AAA family ATPase [Halopiger aswanensis]RKD95619.1 Cdc6-like AAA superfamily ATPase [Halopiger aswanensis]
MSDLIDTRTPLELSHLPAQFVGREAEQDTLTDAFGVEGESRLQDFHVYGSRGTGKTHLLQRFLTTFPPTFTTCYLSGIHQDTQYKALERLYQHLTGTALGTGHHVADIQRKVKEQVTLPTVVVVDEVDFLLLNDGDDLLYYLTRLENTAVITISAYRRSIEEPLDDRTYSSFHPQHLTLNGYTSNDARQILADRARKALHPQSLQRAALTYITATTQNISIGITWLREAAETAEDRITRDLVQDVELTAYHEYVKTLLNEFTTHHRRLYNTIARLEQEQDPPLTTGTVYKEYSRRCETAGVAPLSERRISDFLTHLELLDLIEATYYRGGRKGKTREIKLVDWNNRPDSEETG